MRKKIISLAAILLVGFLFLSLHATIKQRLRLRFFEGIREGKAEPPKFVTSSYLQSTITASIRSKFLLAEEQEQIKKVFNLKDVRLITEADLNWKQEYPEKIARVFRLDSKEYLITITPPDRTQKRRFKVEIFEQTEKDKFNLLETEIILPEKNIAVLGFEDKQGKPYFISFHTPEGVLGGVMGGVLGGVIEKGDEDITKRAIKAEGDIKPPRLIKKVDPVYPEEAKKERVEGIVILEATTDEQGDVAHVKVLKSKDPLLNEAAIDAVRQWKYEPFYIKGKPHGVVFTITVRFKLEERKTEEFEKGAVKIEEEIEQPKLIKKVNPVYPEEARKAGVEGVVTLRARINKEGGVERILVLKSESSLLNQAAIDAVKQWKYEPSYQEGKPVPVVFDVTVRFKLK